MAKTLVIAGSNMLPQYKSNVTRIRELIQNKSGVMNMQITVKPGQTVPLQGAEIVYKDGTRFLFGGYITRVTPTEIGKGQLFVYDVESSDYSFILSNKVAKRAYTNMTLGAIVTDLMDTYVDASYGFDLTNVETGPMITSVLFDHISVRKAFEKLSKLTGYVWNVDYEKKLYFRTQTTTAAPETITDATTTNYQSVNIVYETSQVRNKVVVIGSSAGEASNAPTVQNFTGDGVTRIWQLDDIPASVTYIKENGVSKNFHEKNQQITSDVYVYDTTSTYFYLAETASTPGVGVDIEISYYPYIPVIAEQIDQDSIDFFKALDGGDGVWDYTIKDPSILTRQEASERALRETNEFADPLVKGTFVTRTSLLSPGSIFKVGQVLTVNLPTYGISTDTTFLIQEVNIEVNETDTTTEYVYTVRFGGKLAGVQEFLESLASAADEVTEATDIKTIETVTDSETFEDSNLSYSKQTPPFKYGPAGSPQGKWNLSEWS